MRSNDAFIGLPHDIFSFTFIQELMARKLGVGLGEYFHMVGSLHLYENNLNSAQRYLEEGVLDKIEMPSMPQTDPQEGLSWLLMQEKRLRLGATSLMLNEEIDPYWKDLGQILLLKRFQKNNDTVNMDGIAKQIKSECYKTFISDQQIRASKNSTDPQLNLDLQ